MHYGPSLDDPSLKLEFNCNQGIPGGNNSGVTILKDQSGNGQRYQCNLGQDE